MNSDREYFQSEFAKINKRLDHADKKSDQMMSLVVGLDRRVGSLETRISSLETRMSNVESYLKVLRSDITKVDTKIDDLSENVASLMLHAVHRDELKPVVA